MKHLYLAILMTLLLPQTYAQNATAAKEIATAATDTTRQLPELTVHAYEQYAPILITPAAIGTISASDLNTGSNSNVLQAVNAIPGVRMEERSPGSYRFGIRGSSLESPFGVRNVKVYYNDIPYTDPSGNTYLNQLGFYNIFSLEVIKGPGGSLYGANTGGVLLISSMPEEWHAGATINFTGGSYGLNNTEAEARVGDSGMHSVIRYQHLASDGYRQQSAMRNDVLSWDGVIRNKANGSLDVHFLYGDLYYQTPGALTLKEYEANPKMARPAAGTVPGAVQAQAAIYQQTFLSGFTYRQRISNQWSNSTTLYGDYTRQLNPNLRNYSRVTTPNFGGRTIFNYETKGEHVALKWSTGAEAQQSFGQNKVYNVLNGQPQSMQTDQEVNNDQAMVFTQLTLTMARDWIVTTGASLNRLHVHINTFTTNDEQDKIYSDELAPRIALLRRVSDRTSLYVTAEKGFSPPTTDELVPTGSPANLALSPEEGWNYEAGVRGYAAGYRLYYDVNLFYFGLANTIVERRDSAGGDHYTNSGSTQQAGVELLLRYRLANATSRITPYLRAGYAGYYDRYLHFAQLTSDYSGNILPGTPANTASVGISLNNRTGIYLDADYYFCGRIALDDANKSFALPYHLVNARLGYKLSKRKYTIDLFAGVNNLLNQTYSLGNDINAAGGRYYNTAPPVNYYAGVSLGYLK